MSHISTYTVRIGDVNPAILADSVRSAAADLGLHLQTSRDDYHELATGEAYGQITVQPIDGIEVGYDPDTRWNRQTEKCEQFKVRVIQHYQFKLITQALSESGWRTNQVQGAIGQPFRVQMIS